MGGGGGTGKFLDTSAFLNPISTVVDDPFNGVVDDTLGTNIYGPNSKDKALAAQERAAGLANQQITKSYDKNMQTLDPWVTKGDAALGQLSDNNFMDNWTQDPGYQFRLEQGQNGINNAASSRGLGMSGATMKALSDYNQNAASSEYDKVYNRENARLSQLAGYGQDATNTKINAETLYGNSIANNITGVGNAQAATNIAIGNQRAQTGQQAASMAMMAFSDKKLKEEITEITPKDLEEMKSHLKAYKFKYKSEEFGKGEWIGVMAQDLEKSKLGRWIVTPDEKGNLQVDMKKVMSVFLATLAEAA